MINHENIKKKQLLENVLRLNSFDWKNFAENLKAGIQEIRILENSLCDDILQKNTNYLRERKLYHEFGILITDTDTFKRNMK